MCFQLGELISFDCNSRKRTVILDKSEFVFKFRLKAIVKREFNLRPKTISFVKSGKLFAQLFAEKRMV